MNILWIFNTYNIKLQCFSLCLVDRGDDTTSRERDSDTWSTIKHMLGLWLGARPADIFWTFYFPPPPPPPPNSIRTRVQPTVKRTAVPEWNCVIGALRVMSTVTNLIISSFSVHDTIQPCCGCKTHTHTHTHTHARTHAHTHTHTRTHTPHVISLIHL